jgi:hypothetical protein
MTAEYETWLSLKCVIKGAVYHLSQTVKYSEIFNFANIFRGGKEDNLFSIKDFSDL